MSQTMSVVAAIGLASVAGLVGAVLGGVVVWRKVRAVILEFYRRLDVIAQETAATRAALCEPVQQSGLTRLYVATRTANFLALENATNHLAALRSGSLEPPAISYGFSRAARSLAPRMIRGRESRGGIVICSVALGEAYIERVMPALASQQYYAEVHGFSYALLAETPAFPPRPPAWMKLPLILNLLDQGFERVLYIDADALVTSLDFDAATVFGERRPGGSLRLTEDEDGINSGVMFIEDGPHLRRLLDLTWLYDADVSNGTWEQYALKTLMDMSDAVARHVTIEPDPRRFNSFPLERNHFHRTMERDIWRPGDFICHFSGIRPPELERLIRQYAATIAPLPYYRPAAPERVGRLPTSHAA